MRLATSVLTFVVAGLVSLGLVALYSTTLVPNAPRPIMQLAWSLLGASAAALLARLDYRWLRPLAWPFLAVSVGLLAAVLKYGVEKNGSTRWFELGGVTFQVSELAKLALIVALAHYADRHASRMGTFRYGLLFPGVFVGGMLVLILKEPDWGTTLLLASVTVVMLLAGGVRWRHLGPMLACGVVALGILLAQNSVRLERLKSWLDLEGTKQAGGFQAYQAQLALGSGGPWGEGLGSGAHYNFVVFHQTDFIFAMIGEELGLACTLGVVAAFMAFVLAGVYIAWHARETFGTLLALGLTFSIGLQAFIHIGVVTSVLPNKGLPLPLISRGGSNLFMVLVFVGLLLSVARHAKTPVPVATSDEDLAGVSSTNPC
jgi:cell division protein FtsW